MTLKLGIRVVVNEAGVLVLGFGHNALLGPVSLPVLARVEVEFPIVVHRLNKCQAVREISKQEKYQKNYQISFYN